MDIIRQLAEELKIRETQVEAAVKLIDDGNTIPFIARYRKEATGSLDDQVLRELDERLNYLRNLEKRKEEVAASIVNAVVVYEGYACKVIHTVLFRADCAVYPFKQCCGTFVRVGNKSEHSPYHCHNDKRIHTFSGYVTHNECNSFFS